MKNGAIKTITSLSWLLVVGILIFCIIHFWPHISPWFADDPTEIDYEIAQSFDFTRADGEISGKTVKYFEGDLEWTEDKVGQPYYCISISEEVSNGTLTDELCGVDLEKFDFLNEGVDLPLENYLTLERLTQMNGRIVDMIADPDDNEWWIIVFEDNHYNRYRVDSATFYEHLDIGTPLPITL